jgi:hypothetical protein
MNADTLFSLQKKLDAMTAERDEARNTCLHSLHVAGNQNERLTAERDALRNIEEVAQVQAKIIDDLHIERDAYRALLQMWLDDLDHDVFVICKNGNEHNGIDEGEYYNNMALASTVTQTRAALEAQKGEK